jgi:hypothetical protein
MLSTLFQVFSTHISNIHYTYLVLKARVFFTSQIYNLHAHHAQKLSNNTLDTRAHNALHYLTYPLLHYSFWPSFTGGLLCG